MPTNDCITAAQVSLLEDRHFELLALCLELEELAADLDGGDIPAKVATLAARVEPLLTEAQRLEEESFYPCLEEYAGSCFGSLMIAQIKSEHRLDRRAAHELAMTLNALGHRRCSLSLETVALMVRGFQEYLRRHVCAEQILIDSLLAATGDAAPAAAP